MNYWAEALENSARAIAAAKRGCRPTHPVIDRVWPSYLGQARACVLAFLEDNANHRNARTLAEAALRDSDGSGEAGETPCNRRLDPEGDSAVPEGETPNPSPPPAHPRRITMTERRDVLEVTQADREAAADLALAMQMESTAYIVRRGKGDVDARPLTQAFARHRLAALRAHAEKANG